MTLSNGDSHNKISNGSSKWTIVRMLRIWQNCHGSSLRIVVVIIEIAVPQRYEPSSQFHLFNWDGGSKIILGLRRRSLVWYFFFPLSLSIWNTHFRCQIGFPVISPLFYSILASFCSSLRALFVGTNFFFQRLEIFYMSF